jgi:nicotinate-nucleotide adenylyltransferase
MVEAAIAGEPKMEASRLEIDRKGPSYTVETLQALERAHSGAALFLILGMDSLVDLPHWKDVAGILARAELLVIPRSGAWEIPPMLAERHRVIPFVENPLSSTEVRELIRSGVCPDGVVPPAVERLIRKKGIYGSSGVERPR